MGVPAFAIDALSKFNLADTPWRATGIARGRADAWAIDVHGELAVPLWERLRGTLEPGWWPFVVGGASEEEGLADNVEIGAEAVAKVLESAATVDVLALFDRRRRESEPDPEEADELDLVGTWPKKAKPNKSFVLPFDLRTGRIRRTTVAIVRAEHGYDVPAAAGWGSWNDCPRPEEHVAVLRRWGELYGAELVGLSADVVEMKVARPPTTQTAAVELAAEHYAYCPDIVTQGTGTISNLAATLLGGTCWFFWWD